MDIDRLASLNSDTDNVSLKAIEKPIEVLRDKWVTIIMFKLSGASLGFQSDDGCKMLIKQMRISIDGCKMLHKQFRISIDGWTLPFNPYFHPKSMGAIATIDPP